jgi:quercetin dioxygenase-like cupin family protein
MSSTVSSAIDPPADVAEREIFTNPETSRAWWFLGTLAVLRNPVGAPRLPAVIELTVPPGGSPPRHIHDELEDSFLVLDGEIVVQCGGQTFVAKPATYVVVPRGADHTFRVTSTDPARLLLVHGDDSFLQLIEAAGSPALELRLPPPGEVDMDLDALVQLNAEHDSRIVGPSMEDDDARAVIAANTATEGAASQVVLGAVNHLSLSVIDVSRSAQWYAHAFDLVRLSEEIADDGNGHVLLASPTGGWLLSLTSAATPCVEHVAVTCKTRDELVAWQEILNQRGVTPGTITDAPYGSGFVVRDPDGLDFELFAPPAQ